MGRGTGERIYRNINGFCDFPEFNENTDTDRTKDDEGSIIIEKIQERDELAESIDKNSSNGHSDHGFLILPVGNV